MRRHQVFVEGFNTQMPGAVAPALARSWHVSPGALATFFAIGLAGLFLGAVFVAPLADRIGRRPLLLGCMTFLGITALLTAFSPSMPFLDGARFFTGLATGGAIPNAIALTSEYSPHRRRSLMVALMFTGFVLGAFAVGMVSSGLSLWLGWQWVFGLGGGLALLLAPVVFFALPESIRFLALKGDANDKVAALARKLAPERVFAPGTRFTLSETQTSGAAVFALFREGRAKRTILIWIVCFMSLLDVFLLGSWLPTEMHALGIEEGLAIIIGALFQFGGACGFVFGAMADRAGTAAAMGCAYFLGAVSVVAVALSGADLPLVIAAVFCAGLGIIGGQSVTNAAAAIAYPTEIRATGVGWALGVGRIGAIIGPSLVGLMHALHFTSETIFLFAAIPALIASAAGACLGPMRTALILQKT